ncbi:TOBE domain-containing protein [Rhodoferax sediminis]|uniref:LysR family transcriptional regulator n=1 Tax=Rhodoferax sediminis TaxID=2509614 RepID=A0A515D9B0_9BURK|nr:TOBE domain-containing protein [Rhodoferax sediminis]QDL36999.1 LysR family transcriptional regulator [Rhodoferax sediminis]
MPKPRAPAVSYGTALGHASADKRIEILRLIGRSGSISQAGREAGVSYKAAWQAIDTLTNLAGVALVERLVGGAGGGGASVTAAGRHLLTVADALEQARVQVLARIQQQGDSQAAGMPPALTQLPVRTSMRNQLPCKVQALDLQGQIVRVWLQLAGGAALVSRITVESAELLGLREALPVLALCKATAVSVGRTADAPILHTANVLPGRASRVARGPTGDEVAAQLDGGLQMVGFAAPASGLRPGSRVAMTVEESALVIALID